MVYDCIEEFSTQKTCIERSFRKRRESSIQIEVPTIYHKCHPSNSILSKSPIPSRLSPSTSSNFRFIARVSRVGVKGTLNRLPVFRFLGCGVWSESLVRSTVSFGLSCFSWDPSTTLGCCTGFLGGLPFLLGGRLRPLPGTRRVAVVLAARGVAIGVASEEGSSLRVCDERICGCSNSPTSDCFLAICASTLASFSP